MLRDDPAYADKAARIARWRATSRRSSPTLGLERRAEAGQRAARRLSLRLLAAARPAHRSRSRRRCSPPPASTVLDVPEGASLLRLGRHLQPAAARAGRRAARPQARQYRADRRRARRRRQYRLHHAARRRRGACRSCIRSSCSTGRPAALCLGTGRACRTAARTAGISSDSASAATPITRRPSSQSASPPRRHRPFAGGAEIDRRRSSAATGRAASPAHSRRAAAGSGPARSCSGCAGSPAPAASARPCASRRARRARGAPSNARPASPRRTTRHGHSARRGNPATAPMTLPSAAHSDPPPHAEHDAGAESPAASAARRSGWRRCAARETPAAPPGMRAIAAVSASGSNRLAPAPRGGDAGDEQPEHETPDRRGAACRSPASWRRLRRSLIAPDRPAPSARTHAVCPPAPLLDQLRAVTGGGAATSRRRDR